MIKKGEVGAQLIAWSSLAAKSIRRKLDKRTGKRLSFRKVAEGLADKGFLTAKENAYSASQVKRLLG